MRGRRVASGGMAVAAGIGLSAFGLCGCVTSVAMQRYGDVPLARAGSATTVLVRNHAFIPHVLTVRAGTTVTWLFEDGVKPYDVALAGVTSPALTQGSWSHTFRTAGVFDYRCDIQPDMDGRVVVRG